MVLCIKDSYNYFFSTSINMKNWAALSNVSQLVARCLHIKTNRLYFGHLYQVYFFSKVRINVPLHVRNNVILLTEHDINTAFRRTCYPRWNRISKRSLVVLKLTGPILVFYKIIFNVPNENKEEKSNRSFSAHFYFHQSYARCSECLASESHYCLN
jgi:hypothetical protein